MPKIIEIECLQNPRRNYTKNSGIEVYKKKGTRATTGIQIQNTDTETSIFM